MVSKISIIYKKYNKDYKIENILELIDSYFNALHKNFGWGYSLAHFLSASNETHPNYASYLLDGYKPTNGFFSLCDLKIA